MDDITAIVEYDYKSKELDELTLRKGDIIYQIKQMEGGWWQGTIKSTGMMGMFPDNFVRVIENPSSSNNNINDDASSAAVQLRDKSASTNRRCKVIYSYTQVNDDELTLAVGDVIEFLGEVEEGWWRGRLKNKVGVFPSNFVERIEPSPILAKKRPPSTLDAANKASGPTQGAVAAAAAAAVAAKAAAASASTSSGASSTATVATTKESNRLSFHSSKENLLSSTNSNTAAATTTTLTHSPAAVTASSCSTAAGEDVAPTLPPKALPPKISRDFCRVEFPYAPQNEDELELKLGDVITVISMDLADKGWWRGELRGKVGVFPDNFVKLLPPSEIAPHSEPQPQQAQRTAKLTNTVANATANAVATAVNTTTLLTTSQQHSNSNSTTLTTNSSSNTSKVFIKKSGSTSSTQSSNRKDSFGSRDSLNDILSETGLQSGNVAAQRKSLETKNLDLTNATTDANVRLGIKKQPQQQTITTTTTSSSAATIMSANATGELRKSLDNIDEKTKSPPPPVLTKKPTVPTKKANSVTSVAGNIFTGLKQKVKNVENKLTTAASHDYADGMSSSKFSPGLPDAAPSGNVVMRRAATIAVEDTEFDRVERASILPDMRAGRVKAPKRRPPSAAINVLGESNNNSVYVNGSGMAGSTSELSEDGGSGGGGKLHSSDENSTGEEQLAKPKPREWEKKKAPWMEELKASQVKKKTSPIVEPRNSNVVSVAERTSKLFTDDLKLQNHSSNVTATSSVITSAATSSTASSSTSTKVQSSAVTSSSIMQQSMAAESSFKRESQSSSTITTTQTASNHSTSLVGDSMSKSMSAKITSVTSGDDEARATRPNSLALRKRSISPMVKTEASTTAISANVTSNNSTATTAAATTAPLPTKSALVNNHNHAGNGDSKGTTAESTRVTDLERRVEKLESLVHTQQRTIDDLVRLLREETDRVKVLRGELDKYAQCVTQV